MNIENERYREERFFEDSPTNPFFFSKIWEESLTAKDQKIFLESEIQRWKDAWEWNIKVWKERLATLKNALETKEVELMKIEHLKTKEKEEEIQRIKRMWHEEKRNVK